MASPFRQRGAWGMHGESFVLMLELDPAGAARVFPSLRELVDFCEHNNIELLNRESADEVFASQAKYGSQQ